MPAALTAEPARALSIGQAIALGLLHGPAELLPISSSGHVALVPWLLDWDYQQLDDELRKSFEVALHAGTAAALLFGLRDEVRQALGERSRRSMALNGLSLLPPALAGYRLEGLIERRLGTPPTIAGALLAGSAAMALADRRPQTRQERDAGALDALWLGIAQASALIPGISRNGATLAVLRMRGFNREDANRLSRHAALPVIAGATALKGIRLCRRGLPPGVRLPFAAGAAASFASTLGFRWMIGQVERDRSLSPYAAYRVALASIVAARLVRVRLRTRSAR